MPPKTRPDSTLSPDDQLEATMPGFRPPPTPPGPDPLDPTTSTISDPTTTPASPDPFSDDGSSTGPETDEPGDGASSWSSATTSSRASTADPLPFIEITRTLVGLASMLVRAVRARRRPHLHPTAWLATEEDQANIGDPLGRIAARHAPITGEGSADVADGMAAMVGATGYAIRSLTIEAESDGLALVDVDGQMPDAGAQGLDARPGPAPVAGHPSAGASW